MIYFGDICTCASCFISLIYSIYLRWAYTEWFSARFWPGIWALLLISELDQISISLGVVVHAVYRGKQGPVICSQPATGQSDEFLTCQRFWTTISGTEAEPRADSSILSAFFSTLHLCQVTNRESVWKCHGTLVADRLVSLIATAQQGTSA